MQHGNKRLRRGCSAFWRRKKITAQVLSLLLLGMAAHADGLVSTNALPPATQEVLLRIYGAIGQTNCADGAACIDMEHLRSLPTHTVHTSTVVTDGVKQFDGVLLRHVLGLVGAQGHFLEAQAHNGYVVDIPISDCLNYEVLIATHMDGKRLKLSDKGPLWIVYPRDSYLKLQDIRYDYRWVWQLSQLTIK